MSLYSGRIQLRHSDKAMARRAYEIPINSETTQDDLELCIFEAQHTSDPNSQKAAAKASAEIERRKQQALSERFNAESKERVKSQQFQEAQITRQIQAQEKMMEQQIVAAKEQAGVAERAAEAAERSAEAAHQSVKVTRIMAILTGILVVATVVALFVA